jgi:hypothetical protein
MSSDLRSDMATGSGELFFFDPARLSGLAAELAPRYASADPFPHVVIDDFLPDEVIAKVIASFPDPREARWQRFDNAREVKLASTDAGLLPPSTRQLLNEINSATMIEFLEQLTGIDGLIPDPHLWGGGLHQIEPGGHLQIHSDFNWHKRLLLDRRVNLLVYLNEDWDEDWGGALELWDRDMTTARQRIAPIANRCVVFSTTDYSFHGHPDPLTCPPGRTRRSLALYYYSNGRPAHEVSPSRTTAFQPRPGDQWRRSDSRGNKAERWLPPAVLDAARAARRSLRGTD